LPTATSLVGVYGTSGRQGAPVCTLRTPVPTVLKTKTGTTEVINTHKVSSRLVDAGDPTSAAKVVASYGGKSHQLITGQGGYASLVVHGSGTLVASASVPTYHRAVVAVQIP